MSSPYDEHFLLGTPMARLLYEEHARPLPILDYHGHLPAQEIASDRKFSNLTRIWLHGDHYKWRAMRAQGIAEEFITGTRSDEEKFRAWASTVPHTLGNPLFHWTHLELERYFGLHDYLNPGTAPSIYHQANALLQTPEFSVRNLLGRMKVQGICTTDDPADQLDAHRQLQQDGSGLRVLPGFRPDRALDFRDPGRFAQYLKLLESASNQAISTWDDYLAALQQRHDYFHARGCRVADHGLEQIGNAPYSQDQLRSSFAHLRSGRELEGGHIEELRSALLEELAGWHAQRGWVQQFHLGAFRNNNSRMYARLGPDSGWDSIGDFRQGPGLRDFLDKMDGQGRLARTVLYNANPADNALMASMTGNFNDGTIPGKIQWGPPWWFLDQQDGIEEHLRVLSGIGLLSRFIGMTTDSRSFLSFPRHEYFRRILCNFLGRKAEAGELPADPDWLGKLVRDLCYNNARNYFGWEDLPLY